MLEFVYGTPNATKIGLFCQLDRFPISWIPARFMDRSTILRMHTRVLKSIPEIDSEIDPEIDPEIDLGNDIENVPRIVLPNDLENVPGIVLWNNLNCGRIKLQERFLTCSNLALDVLIPISKHVV